MVSFSEGRAASSPKLASSVAKNRGLDGARPSETEAPPKPTIDRLAARTEIAPGRLLNPQARTPALHENRQSTRQAIPVISEGTRNEAGKAAGSHSRRIAGGRNAGGVFGGWNL